MTELERLFEKFECTFFGKFRGSFVVAWSCVVVETVVGVGVYVSSVIDAVRFQGSFVVGPARVDAFVEFRVVE